MSFAIFIKTGLLAYLVCPWLLAAQEGQQAEDLWHLAKGLRLEPAPTPTASGRVLAEWGARLFFDKGLSRNGEISCASCHQPERFFTDGLPVAKGLARGARNTPSIINSFQSPWLFWDGRADSLAAQALGPLENPLEHGLHRLGIVHAIWHHHRDSYLANFSRPSEALIEALDFDLGIASFAQRNELTRRLQQVMRARAEFVQAELRTINWHKRFDALSPALKLEVNTIFARVGLALAAFQASIGSQDSAFDRFIDRWNGQGSPEDHLASDFTQTELNGLRVFVGKGNCLRCHHGPFFTDNVFHHVGFPHDIPDHGRILGLRHLMSSEFACEQDVWKDDPRIAQSSACREKPYLPQDARDMIGAFKTPGLRHVVETAPYGHAGRFATLAEVLHHYNAPDNSSRLGQLEGSLERLDLSGDELEDLEAFLGSLSGDWFSNIGWQPATKAH